MKPEDKQFFHRRMIGVAQTRATTAWIDARNAHKNNVTRKVWYVVVLDRETDKLFNILDKER